MICLITIEIAINTKHTVANAHVGFCSKDRPSLAPTIINLKLLVWFSIWLITVFQAELYENCFFVVNIGNIYVALFAIKWLTTFFFIHIFLLRTKLYCTFLLIFSRKTTRYLFYEGSKIPISPSPSSCWKFLVLLKICW